MRLLTENSLGRKVAGGDERAFEELFRRYRGPLYGYCYSILGNQDDSLDALQNTMAKALDHLPGSDAGFMVKPWLFRVAHNECIDLIRSRRATTDITDHEIACTSELENQVADRERLRQIISDLGQLPERQRNALVLRELNGLGFDEIGQSIGATPSAAKQIVYEARCSLQAESDGQAMACDSARQAISERDGRVLRSRKIRAHLRSCSDCTAFRDGIHTRSGELRALVPPLPLFAVASMLQAGTAVQGGGAVVTGASGLASGGGMLGAAGIKVAAVVVVAAGVSAVGVGVVDRSGSDQGTGQSVAISRGSGADAASPGTGVSFIETGSGNEGTGRGRNESQAGGNGESRSNEQSSGPGTGSPSAQNSSDTPGKSGSAPGHSNAGGAPGASGGSKGRGAVPSGGGKPSVLPLAAQKGQQQAQTSQDKVVTTGRPVAKPTPPPPPAKPVQSDPPAAKKADPKVSSN